MELSIIIPAYNARETICDTLDSIKMQELSITFEVVIVNDSSDYDYSEIISKYNEYFNVKELVTPENLGPGGARQYGIDNSTSEYIVFIDSDDVFYDSNSISKMYDKITKNQADILISNFITQVEDQMIIKKANAAWLHGKMYKRSFLTENNIKFNNTRANEDNGFNRLILLLRPNYVIFDEVVYIYKENMSSITRRNNRSYCFTGLEGFCYNMNWAMEEALLRMSVENDVAALALDVLLSLYVYYLAMEKEYEVSKILDWGKEIKEKYYKYRNFLEYDYNLEMLESKKEFLKDDFIVENFYISFEEFLDKM